MNVKRLALLALLVNDAAIGMDCDVASIQKDLEERYQARAVGGDIEAQYELGHGLVFRTNFHHFTHLPKEYSPKKNCKRLINSNQAENAYNKGLVWLKLAAKAGHKEAMYQVGEALLSEGRRARNLTKMQLIACKLHPERKKIWGCLSGSLRWHKIDSAEREKLIEWANSRHHDNEYTQDIERYFRMAAELRHIKAQFALAHVLSSGIGVKSNDIEAQAWYILAVSQNPPFGSQRRDSHSASLSDAARRQSLLLADEYIRKYTNFYETPSKALLYD